ncbi:MAG: hypothetical protein K2X81_20005 [Candidatus Obscuribacterales bacterium]|nr:hypothetical protein [Candidatus Obscuribacterales bacterium]
MMSYKTFTVLLLSFLLAQFHGQLVDAQVENSRVSKKTAICNSINLPTSETTMGLIKKLEIAVPYNAQVSTNGCMIEFSIDKTGRIKQIDQWGSSGHFDFDFECLSGILLAQPFSSEVFEENPNRLFGWGTDVEPKDGFKALLFHGERDFRTRTSCRPERYVLVHLIPICVSWRYPGVLTDEEISSPKNIRVIQTRFFEPRCAPNIDHIMANKQYKEFCEDWIQFFIANPKVTSQQVHSFADQLAERYKDMLILPEEMKPMNEGQKRAKRFGLDLKDLPPVFTKCH